MASKVDICNMALANIGSYVPISSLDERSKEARACALFYEHCLEIMLREYPWGFAKRNTPLASLGDAPDGWDYRYQYPTDAFYIVRVGDFTLQNTRDDFTARMNEYMVVSTESGKAILAQRDEITCTYIIKPDNPNVFDSMFVDALAWFVSARIAPGITGSMETAGMAGGQYQAMLQKAIARDLGESGEPPRQEAETIRIRDTGWDLYENGHQ